MRYLFVFFFVCISFKSNSQFRQLSPKAEISLLTIGPGENLYDTFGHTAVHVEDTDRNLNVVFNYGYFNLEAPNFYLKFARGKLLYKLGVNPYDEFYESYVQEQRWIKAQVLNLTIAEKQAVFNFLAHNAKPENSTYLYDFFYDNCATRPLDVLRTISNNQLQLHIDNFPSGKTHRDLIHDYVPVNTWGRLGIDIALGSIIDKKVDHRYYLFLPDYMMDAFAKAELTNAGATKSLVAKTEDRFVSTDPASYGHSFVLSPFLILTLLAILLIWKTYTDLKTNRRPYLLDKLILAITGIIGISLFLLWTATDHTATAWNYNLLWAFPFNFIVIFAFSKTRQKKWILPYLKLVIILLALLLTHWIIGVQVFAIALIPILIALVFRYIYMWKMFNAQKPQEV